MNKLNPQKMMLLTMILCAVMSVIQVKLHAKTNSKSDSYQLAQQKKAITTHGDKFKIKPKVKQLNPMPYLTKPDLNGNFSHQQQYQSAQKRLNTRAKLVTADDQ